MSLLQTTSVMSLPERRGDVLISNCCCIITDKRSQRCLYFPCLLLTHQMSWTCPWIQTNLRTASATKCPTARWLAATIQMWVYCCLLVSVSVSLFLVSFCLCLCLSFSSLLINVAWYLLFFHITITQFRVLKLFLLFFDSHEKCEDVMIRLAECLYVEKKLQHYNFLGHWRYDKCQTLCDRSTHWALPIHTTFSDLDV